MHSIVVVGGPGLLLVLIHASANGVKVRDVIRDTWVSPRVFLKLDKDIRNRVDYKYEDNCMQTDWVVVGSEWLEVSALGNQPGAWAWCLQAQD